MEGITRRSALMFTAAAPLAAQSGATAHPVVHFEIGCRDRERSAKYFGDLFGWQFQAAGPATEIETGGHGIPGHLTTLGHDPFHYTTFYVEVDDVKAALDKAVTLGGKMVVPPVKIPQGTFAWFSDPDGNVIGLLKKG